MNPSQQLSEICGQLIVGGYLGADPTPTFLAELQQRRRAGAILFKRNLPSWEAGHAASAKMVEAVGDDLSPIVCLDQEGGRVARLGPPVLQVPSMRRLGDLGDEALVSEVARTLGSQLLPMGFNLNFAPVLDVDTNPANPVIGDRSFSRDPEVVARMGAAWVRGLQASGIAACGKHFPGHGDTTVDSHLDLPSVDTPIERLRQVELLPFRAAMEAGVDALMSAHIVVRAVSRALPATLCPEILRGWLREQMGFEGVIFSDDLEMKAIADRWEVGDAAVQAVRAGCDVLLICKSESWQIEAHDGLVREAEKDAWFRQRCERAAGRCRALRARRPIVPGSPFSLESDRVGTLQRRLDAVP
jgi:beta-N-acetylhexosaminidase